MLTQSCAFESKIVGIGIPFGATKRDATANFEKFKSSPEDAPHRSNAVSLLSTDKLFKMLINYQNRLLPRFAATHFAVGVVFKM